MPAAGLAGSLAFVLLALANGRAHGWTLIVALVGGFYIGAVMWAGAHSRD